MTLTITDFDDKKIELLKNTICKGANNNELELFLHACKRTGLDPFMRQIYCVIRQGVMTIQVGIDGYRLIAERTGKYAPGKETIFEYNEDKSIRSATVYIKKQTQDGTWHEMNATVFFNEFCAKTKEGRPMAMWAKMPGTMIEKCAEAKALRRAFPAELSGVYTKEEMEQAENPIDIIIEEPIQTQTTLQSEPEIKPILPEECITKEQIDELKTILALCSQDHRTTRAKILARAPHNVKDLAQMPKNIYQTELEMAKLNAQLNQHKKEKENGQDTDHE